MSCGFDHQAGWEDPLEEGVATHSSIFDGESYGQRSLVGCNPGSHKESDMTEATQLTCTQYQLRASLVADGKESTQNEGGVGSIPGSGKSPGEGNGSPIQYSCLENSTDSGTWQATVHGVAELDMTE